MREQLQCCCIIVPAVRPHNRFKHLMILFPTSTLVVVRAARRETCTTCEVAGVLNTRFSSQSITMSFCMRDTKSTSISTGDPISFWRWPPSRKLFSGKPSGKGLGTARTSRGAPWGSGAGRPPPPLGGVITSSYIKIHRPGDNRKVRLGFRTAVPPLASMGGRLSITGGRSLPVCRGLHR